MRRLSHRNDHPRCNRSNRYRTGFTLVELLVVIAIIGVLAGLLVPAVFAVRKTFNNASVKFEVQGLADAVEKYRTKYGEYPPDGSSWPIMEAHFRKAFPGILQSELLLLNPANNANANIRSDYAGRVMDPAEAMVFFLGGFSTDSQKPFSGKGGPLLNSGTPASPVWSYNPSRDNAMYEFKNERLSLADDTDLMPVYVSYGTTVPYVYFDSRTYQSRSGAFVGNYHAAAPTDPLTPAGLMGVARPLLSPSTTTVAIYENPKTFQIISPGMDGLYGWDIQPSSGTPILFSSTGQGYANGSGTWSLSSAANRFRLPTHLDQFNRQRFPMLDNVSNCVEPPTFGDAIK
ncbi:MAG: prepilin-type N-terminal cleavage/methylation domain-containing protein [Planctomycetota bacterium]|nr:prepilin-type N-terminal cleavage/methylation domain-containing protein [Planctomycetota bacterium]